MICLPRQELWRLTVRNEGFIEEVDMVLCERESRLLFGFPVLIVCISGCAVWHHSRHSVSRVVEVREGHSSGVFAKVMIMSCNSI